MELPKVEAGTEVVISEGTIRESYTIETVAHITPTGIIKMESGRSFNPDGMERGAKPSVWRDRAKLTAISPETIRRENLRRKLLVALELQATRSKATVEDIRQAMALLGIAEPK